MGYDRLDEAVEAGMSIDLSRQATEMVEPKALTKEGSLRVWWVRNMPREATHYRVTDLIEAVHLYARLVWHDLQRGDIESNAGGLEVYHDGGGWEDWEEDEALTPLTLLTMRNQGRWIDSFDDVFDALMDALRGDDDE